jgi:beta-lactamase regulating signal transducer with metallopeptidase domain
MVFSHLLDAAWKGTALIVVVFALCLILGRRRTATRYWLCVYSLVGLLVLPVASFVAKEHRFALLPARQAAAGVRPAARESEIGSSTDRTPVAGAAEHTSPTKPAAADHLASESAAESLSAKSPAPDISVVPSTSTRGLNTQAPVLKAVATTSRCLPFQAAIGLAWLAVCFLLLVRLALAAIATARFRHSSIPASSPLVLNLFERAKESARLRTRAKVRLSGRIASPISIGVFRPTILLPESLALEMPPEQLRPILLHELAHIRMGDYAVNVLQRFVEALFFFHPFVYLLSRRVRRLREEICDNWVLSRLPDAIVYAKALTALAERWISPKRNLVGVGLFNRPVRLSSRIERILACGMRFSTSLRLRTALVLLTVSVLAVGALSVTTLSARAAKPEKKEPAKTKTAAPAETPAAQAAISWKDQTVYRDGKPYAKIVQWEPEADFPMVAFGDQNNNGKTDTWIRFLNGKPLRIEIDSNEDGRIDKWEHYFDGVIDLVEVDSDFNRRVDLWQVYDKGRLFREEIDLNADGSVDKWLEVDEKGELLEKEISSWVVENWLLTEVARSRGLRDPAAYARATLFNAKDGVQEVEEKPAVPEPSAPVAPSPLVPGAAPRTARPASPYIASTGSRIEYTKEVDGAKVVSAWFHQSVSAGDARHSPWERAALYPYPAYEGVRYMAYDRGFDGGVDSWDQIGPPIPEEAPSSQFGPEVLFRVLFEDKNRDGKADTCQVQLASDAPSRQVPVEKLQTRCRDDGLVDMYLMETRLVGLGLLRTSLRDFNGDGVLDSFGPEVRFPSYVEPVGSSVVHLQLKLTGGEEPPPMLSKLELESGQDGQGVGRAFWLIPREQATLRKLSRGVFNLTIRAGKHYQSTTFFYPTFLTVDKGQALSRVLNWDCRPVFRGKLLDADAQPRGYRRLTLSASGRPALSITLYTDAAGDFEVSNAPPGQYLLSVQGSSFTQTIDVRAPSDQAPERKLVLSTLGPEPRAEPRPPSPPGEEKPPTWKAPMALFGKVLSHEGEALPNMKLVLSQVRGKGEEAGITRTAVTGLDGSYRVLILPPGRYSVSIYNNDFPGQEPVEQLSVEVGTALLQKDFRLSAPLPVAAE